MKPPLDKAKKILITSAQDADFDTLAACINLGKLLKAQGKKISLHIPTDKYSKQVFELFPTGDLKLIQKTNPDSFILSLPKEDAVVKDVKWKEEKGNIEIYITTEKGSIPTNSVTMQPHRAMFDLVLTVGVGELEQIGEFFRKNSSIFSKNRVFAIPESHISQSANVFEYLLENFENVGADIATDLFAGFLWKTNGLRYDTKSSTSELLKFFINQKANFQSASKKAFQNTDLSDIRMIDTILKNLTVKNSTLAYASIKNTKSKGLEPEKIRTYDWFVLDSFKGIETFFVLFELQENVLGYLINKNPLKNANELTTKYKMTGNECIAKFISTDTLEKTQKTILEGLGEIQKTEISKPIGTAESTRSAETEDEVSTEPTDPNPLAPAVEIPQPLQLDGDNDDGFMPPPPITPLEPV